MKLIQFIPFLIFFTALSQTMAAEWADDTFYMSFDFFSTGESSPVESFNFAGSRFGKNKAPIAFYKNQNLKGTPVIKLYPDGIQFRDEKKKHFKDICYDLHKSYRDKLTNVGQGTYEQTYKDIFSIRTSLWVNGKIKDLKSKFSWKELYCKIGVYWTHKINDRLYKTHFKNEDYYISLPDEQDLIKKNADWTYHDLFKASDIHNRTDNFFDAKIKKEKYFSDLKNFFIKCSKKKTLTCLKEINKIITSTPVSKHDAYSLLLDYLDHRNCINDSCTIENVTNEDLEKSGAWKEIGKIGKNLGAYWNTIETTAYFGYEPVKDGDEKKTYLLFVVTYIPTNQNKIENISIMFKTWNSTQIKEFSDIEN